MKVMILAAGYGKRMLPLTATTPKPLLKAGAYSLIEWQIRKLAKAGLVDLVINLHHLGEQIVTSLGDGSRLGANIQYSFESELLETAGGIVKALPLLGEDAFIVVNSDIWTDFDFARLQSVDGNNTLAHLVLVPNADHHPQGDFHLGIDGLVAELQQPRCTFSGISVLHPRLFAGLTPQRLPLSPLLRAAMSKQQVTGEYFSGDWQDIGSPERLKALECRLSNVEPAPL